MYLGFQVIVDNLIITYAVKIVNTEVIASWCYWVSTCSDKSIITPLSSNVKPSATVTFRTAKEC